MANCDTPMGCADASAPGPDEMDLRLRDNMDKIRHKLVVMSGKGGVGKSTVSLYLALGLAAQGLHVGLLDVDLHGPSISRMLGINQHAKVQEKEQTISPIVVEHGLSVLSLEMLMPDRESSVIWRGPLKIGVIKQFLADVNWGMLDYLVIDCPPGTGDVPMTVAQMVDQARAVLVTSPQEIALADVRKSVDFCHQMQVPVLGVVENMSGLVCPHCQQSIDLLGKGGGRKLARRFGMAFLAEIPWDTRVVTAADSGKPLDLMHDYNQAGPGIRKMVEAVIERCGPSGHPPKKGE